LPLGERGYFTFKGSLTTPPCAEGVTWYVLQSHPTISPEQNRSLRKNLPYERPPYSSNRWPRDSAVKI